VKISPDLPDDELDRVADLAVDLELDGIVAVNTTTTRPPLKSLAPAVELHGGLSGAPLQPRAVDVLRRLYARTRGEVALVSVGGVETAEDAWERICAGATLVQAYTGFIYGGPLWAARVNRGLARLARVHGVSNLQDAIGSSITSVRTVSSGAGRIENGPPPAADAPLRMS
jgi:dihydroorotate dehydrogenase